MRKNIEEKLLQNKFIKINPECSESLEVLWCLETKNHNCTPKCKNDNPINEYWLEYFFKIFYETKKQVFNIYLKDIDKIDFFHIEPIDLEYFPNDRVKFLKKISSNPYYYKSEFINSNYWKIVLGIDYSNVEQPSYFISIPNYIKFYFDSENEFTDFGDKLNDWIQNLLDSYIPKTFEGYDDPIFSLNKSISEYNSPFFDKNKVYLNDEIEKDLKNMLENYNDEDYKSLKRYIYDNVEAYTKYEYIVEKIKEYGGRKVEINEFMNNIFSNDIKNFKDDFKYLEKILPNYKNSVFFGKLFFKKNQDANNLQNFKDIFLDFPSPKAWGCCASCCMTKQDVLKYKYFSAKEIENIEIYVFDNQEYGIYEELWKKLELKHLTFPFSFVLEKIMKTNNFILLNKKNKNKVYYTLYLSDFYNFFYKGKYDPLKKKYIDKIAKIEKDIFFKGFEDKVNEYVDVFEILEEIGMLKK